MTSGPLPHYELAIVQAVLKSIEQASHRGSYLFSLPNAASDLANEAQPCVRRIQLQYSTADVNGFAEKGTRVYQPSTQLSKLVSQTVQIVGGCFSEDNTNHGLSSSAQSKTINPRIEEPRRRRKKEKEI